MCVLEWCKLFGEKRNDHYSWKQIIKDPTFKTDLLRHLELDEAAFEKKRKIFRDYRDQWVAHSDKKREGLYPALDIAKKAVWFYYERIGNEQVDQEMHSKTIETGYTKCVVEASTVYGQAAASVEGQS